MSSPSYYVLYGSDGSPYSCKLRALLRYRRIPFQWKQPSTEFGSMANMLSSRFPDLKAKVIPVLEKPDGSYANDSTPLILELEEAFKYQGDQVLRHIVLLAFKEDTDAGAISALTAAVPGLEGIDGVLSSSLHPSVTSDRARGFTHVLTVDMTCPLPHYSNHPLHKSLATNHIKPILKEGGLMAVDVVLVLPPAACESADDTSVPEGRSVVPRAHGDAFLCALLEDFADEWMTKVMFEGRFHTSEDATFGAAWQLWQGRGGSEFLDSEGTGDMLAGGIDAFAARQVKRRARITGVSGGDDWTMLTRTLVEVCETLTQAGQSGPAAAGSRFLFGDRPTSADFALFGQVRG